MWTAKNRGRYDRSKLRYPSDLTDDEWAHVAPLIAPAKRGGNRRHVDVREVMNGIMYVLSTGCQWRAIPKDLPPRSTLFDYLDLWSWDGTLDRIHHALYAECRERGEREASPTAAIQFGPADYSMSIGRAGQLSHPDVRKAEQKTIETALKKGIHPRAEISEPSEASRYVEMGVKYFCIGWDVDILHGYWRSRGQAMQELLVGLANKSSKAKRQATGGGSYRRAKSA